MNSSKYTMTLDLHSSQSQYSISARLGDTNRKLLINLTDGGVPYKIPEDCSAYISIKRPNDVPFEEYCTIKGNTVIEYQFGEGTCAISGIHNCDLTLYSLEGKVLGSPKFTLVVNDRAVKDDTLDTSTKPWRIIDDAAKKETERQNNEKLRVEAEAERQSKDAERDSKISDALDKSSVANTNASNALGFASSAYDTAQGAFNTSEQASYNANEARRVAGEADTKSSNALSQAAAAKSQSDSTRTSLINLSAQVQGIGRTYVIPTFRQFIDFLRDDFDIVLKEDRDGDGVNETYRIKVNDLKSGDNIIITEKGVPDFWFERNTALTEFESYTYDGYNYSLGSIVGGVVVGGAHVLETDYTVIEGHAISAAASANKSREYANQAQRSAELADNVVKSGGDVYSNVLKGKKSGGIVAMSDISPLEKTLDVRVRGKNLIPYPFYNTNTEASGITITDNGDGSLTFNGTAKSKVYCYLLYSYTNMFKRGTYILSGMPTKSGAILRFECYKDGVYGQGVSSTENGAAITLTDDYNQFRLFVSIDSGVTVSNLTVYPQFELGTVATAHAPYIPDISAVKVKKMGKNLVPYPYVNASKTQNGITFTDNGDGSITINGTSTAEAYFSLASRDTIKTSKLAAGSYTISGHNSNIIINATKNGSWWFQNGKGVFNEGDTFTGMAIVVPKEKTFNNVTVYPQLEMGAVATEYEPYIDPVEYAVNADGTVEGVLPIYPTTTLITDTASAVIDVEYNRDINKAFAELYNAIISLGGNV